MSEHKVTEGEHLSRIAAETGHCQIERIWNHPQNQSLKSVRKNPHVLNPGDIVFVPDPQGRDEACATEDRHRFQLQADKLTLRLKLVGLAGPFAGVPCEVRVESGEVSRIADPGGLVVLPVAPKDEKGRIVVHLNKPHVTMPIDLDVPLLIGHLRPIDTLEGQRARLVNLGYLLNDDDGDPDAENDFRSAVEEFQCDKKLAVDGICGPKTQAKLLEAHGS